MPMLEVRGVSRFFGGLAALTDVSFGLSRAKYLRSSDPTEQARNALQCCKRLLPGLEGRGALQGHQNFRASAP